jgi:hypothetical protein
MQKKKRAARTSTLTLNTEVKKREEAKMTIQTAATFPTRHQMKRFKARMVYLRKASRGMNWTSRPKRRIDAMHPDG